MKRKVALFISAAALLAAALIAAGCDSSGNGSSYSSGAKQLLLGTTRRANGSERVTYGGHPLYRFLGDLKPGQIKGEGSESFGAGWDAVFPAGKKIESDD